MNQFQKTFDDIVELTRAKPTGTEGSFSGLCPSHDDKSPSLSITLENERILLYCHTGCTIDNICLSLGIEQTDLFAPRDEKQINRVPASQKAESDQKRMKANLNSEDKVVFFSIKHKKKVTESVRYSYFNADGKTAYHVIRSDPKDFRPLKPDGYLNIEGVERLPYRLPELLQGVKESKQILLLEGEKDVERAMDMGFVATTFYGGAGKWRDEYLEYFRDADVVLMLGKKLDYTNGFGGNPPFADDTKFVVVDPSPAQVARARTAAVGIVGDVGPIVTQMADAAEKRNWDERTEWVEMMRTAFENWHSGLAELGKSEDPMHPMHVSNVLQKFIDDDTHVTFDGGDYCHFLRASIKRDAPYRFHNVSSFGMIGVGLPYAVGAQVALPDSKVILANGDGSLGFNGMEIDTMVRHNLSVKMFVGNNSIWGIDWQIQKGLYGRPVWTDLLPTRYDVMAQGLGAHGEHVTKAEDLEGAMKRAFAYDGPALLNIDIEQVISPVAEAAISRKTGSHG